VARQHLEAYAASAEVVNDVDEVAQVAPQAVELPDDKNVTVTECFQCRIESRPRIELTVGAILIEPAGGNPGGT
jgi:hypothetical protein